MKLVMKNENIIEIDEQSFVEKVIDASQNSLILVDFWAPWCGPCKQLTPILSEIANENKDKFVLAKINIDENQQIAAQLRIQSIPTVFAFLDKKIADAFQGVLPKQKIIEFIEKSLGESLGSDNSEDLDEVRKLIENEQFEQAIDLLDNFLIKKSDNIDALSLYIECLSSLSRFEEAKNFIKALSKEIKNDAKIIASISLLELSQKNDESNSSLEELNINHSKDPQNVDIVIDIGEKYFAEKKFDEAFDFLLQKYSTVKSDQQKKIKETLLKFFNMLGNDNDYTKKYRKKFSSIMFS